MISGLLCFKQNPNENVLVVGEVSRLSFCCGAHASDFVSFLKNPGRVEAEGDLYWDDIDLRALPPEFVSPALTLVGFEADLHATLKSAKTFVLVDLSYLRKAEAEEALRLLRKEHGEEKILVYAPQCKSSALGLSITCSAPDELERLERRDEMLDSALDAFVCDLATGEAPRDGVLFPEAEPVPEETPKEEILPPSQETALDENSDADDIPLSEEDGVALESAPESKKGWKERAKFFFVWLKDFLVANADYLFAALFCLLALALNIIVHAMPKEEGSNSPLLCVSLAFVFSICSAVPNVFIVKDAHDALAMRSRLAYALQSGLCALCFSSSLTLAMVADYGIIAYVFPFAFLLSPLLTIAAALYLERKRIAAHFHTKKEERHVS